MLHAYYDCIVVGAGISGLYTTRELLKQHPGWKIALAEKYKGLGGRTYSYSPGEPFKDVHWEMGAGRIHTSHKLLMKLVKEYNLTFIPISSTMSYLEGPGKEIVKNTFESELIPLYIEPLSSLSPSILATHTIQTLMNKIYGQQKTKMILSHFPYKAEVSTLRADLGLKSFLKNGEMSTHEGYGILKEGFSELVARLRNDIEARGCTILPRHELTNLQKTDSGATDLTFKFGYGDGTIQLRATKCVVLALHKDAVASLKPFRGWSTLKYLKSEPLLRTYMIFDTSKGPVWFSDLERIVTPERPRFILPMDPSKGSIMISYTDASDTDYYMKQKTGLKKIILEDIRRLFPDRTIPNPVFFRDHPWTTGATYWLPGHYDPEKISLESIHPLPSLLPSVWLCGESWSMRQAWVEGALEQSQLCLDQIKKTASI
jgi:hypothetical protein